MLPGNQWGGMLGSMPTSATDSVGLGHNLPCLCSGWRLPQSPSSSVVLRSSELPLPSSCLHLLPPPTPHPHPAEAETYHVSYPPPFLPGEWYHNPPRPPPHTHIPTPSLRQELATMLASSPSPSNQANPSSYILLKSMSSCPSPSTPLLPDSHLLVYRGHQQHQQPRLPPPHTAAE